MFRPYKGMLYEMTEENISRFEKGDIAPAKVSLHIDYDRYYSLTDEFHERSQKRTWESAFRSLKSSNLKVSPKNIFVATMLGRNYLLTHDSFCTLFKNRWLDDSVRKRDVDFSVTVF